MYAKCVCNQIEGAGSHAAGIPSPGCSTYKDNRFSITPHVWEEGRSRLAAIECGTSFSSALDNDDKLGELYTLPGHTGSHSLPACVVEIKARLDTCKRHNRTHSIHLFMRLAGYGNKCYKFLMHFQCELSVAIESTT